MEDYKDFLQRRRMIIDLSKDAGKLPHVVQSRNQLLAKARGTIRQHLQRQILEAILDNHEPKNRKSRHLV